MSTKKFLAVFDGLKYSPGTTAYAIEFARMADAYVAGAFLDDFTYHSYSLKSHSYAKLLTEKRQLQEHDILTRDQSVKEFKKTCDKAGIEHAIHHDRSIAAREAIYESVYADMLVVNKNETFTQYEQHVPTSFLQEILAGSECPVMVVPPDYKPINKIVILYDGEPASVYAVKLFSYLFPAARQLPVEVITVKPYKANHHVPESHLVKELINRHFNNVSYTVAEGEPKREIPQLLKFREQNEIVVLGSYQRSEISRWLKPSMADLLMYELKTPLFISHR